MARNYEIETIIEDTRHEMLFAIKERINAMTRGATAPIQMRGLFVRDRSCSGRDSIIYEITNVFIDDDNRLCADLAGKDERFSDGVLFGKEIEHLPVEDLKHLLDALYSDSWNIDAAFHEMTMNTRRDGLYGFLMNGKTGISRILRRGM